MYTIAPSSAIVAFADHSAISHQNYYLSWISGTQRPRSSSRKILHVTFLAFETAIPNPSDQKSVVGLRVLIEDGELSAAW